MKFTALLAGLVLGTSMVSAEHHGLDAVLKAEHRSETMARDVYRHPKETLEFFQVKPDMKVIEISPGGKGWYTEILAPYMKGKGKLVLGHYDKNTESSYFQRNYKSLMDKLSGSPELYDQVEIATFHPPGVYDLGEMGTYDRVVTFRNVHNWMRHGDDEMAAIFKLFYDSLKPGGKLGVIDHRLPEDREKNGQGGYVKQSYVVALAEAAGFKLEASSEINANAKDTADYEKGVWTLPPVLRLGNEDREKYLAIGESDRMTLLFVK